MGRKDTWDVVRNKGMRDSSKGTKICISHRNLYGQLDGQVYGQTDWCQEGAIPLLIVESTQARARLSVHNIQHAWIACLYSLFFLYFFFAKQILRLLLQTGGQVQDTNLRYKILKSNFRSIFLGSHA